MVCAAPTCVFDESGPNSCRSFFLHLKPRDKELRLPTESEQEDVKRIAQKLFHKHGAIACVIVPSLAVTKQALTGMYIVVTLENTRDLSALKKSADKFDLPGWKLANRDRLRVSEQRLFGWGDISATNDKLHQLGRSHDAPELRIVLPEAKSMITMKVGGKKKDAKFRVEPKAIVNAAQHIANETHTTLLAVKECEHIFKPVMLEKGKACAGPRRGARDTHHGQYHQCTSCDTLFCDLCLKVFKRQDADEQEVLKALHEMKNMHDFKPVKFGQCKISYCDRTDAVQRCSCGEERCLKCIHNATNGHVWELIPPDFARMCNTGSCSANATHECSCKIWKCEPCYHEAASLHTWTPAFQIICTLPSD